MRVCFSRVPSRAQRSAWEPWGPLSYIRACEPHREGRMIRRHKHGWLVVVLTGAALAARVPATASDSISTRSAKAGDPFTATVSQDVKDATGRVVIPAGATVSGTITAAEPAPNPNSTGKIELSVTSVSVRGSSYSIDGSVVAKDTVMKGRGVTGADAAKVAGGAVAGAIVGRLLGKNKKGTLIGGVAGAAAGAAAAR